jgi:ribosomal protein L29
MKSDEKKSILAQISDLKKELMMMRVKASSGESIVIKDYRQKKKEVARLFTQINNKKAEG